MFLEDLNVNNGTTILKYVCFVFCKSLTTINYNSLRKLSVINANNTSKNKSLSVTKEKVIIN